VTESGSRLVIKYRLSRERSVPSAQRTSRSTRMPIWQPGTLCGPASAVFSLNCCRFRVIRIWWDHLSFATRFSDSESALQRMTYVARCRLLLACVRCRTTRDRILLLLPIRRQNIANIVVGQPRAGARLRRGCVGSPSAAASGAAVTAMSFVETLERGKP
jgi:hypothetical protein